MHFNLKYQKETEPAASCPADHGAWIPKSYLKVTLTLHHSLSHCLTETRTWVTNDSLVFQICFKWTLFKSLYHHLGYYTESVLWTGINHLS